VRIIYNGAEPISGAVCEKFTADDGAAWSKKNTILPAYGLAEASVAVALVRPGAPLKTHTFETYQA